jgi:hypothetical protein
MPGGWESRIFVDDDSACDCSVWMIGELFAEPLLFMGTPPKAGTSGGFAGRRLDSGCVARIACPTRDLS